MSASPYDVLIAKYLSENISQVEKETLFKWITSDTENKKRFEETEKLWHLKVPKSVDIDFQTNQEWHKIEPLLEIEPTSHSFRLSIFLKMAASIVLLIISTVCLYLFLYNSSGTVVETTGTILTFTLPDGSVVTLNKNSKLEYSKDFNTEVREINFEGEAYFDITKNAAKPFVIALADAKVKVLGTSFNVAAYKKEATVEVFVNSGKVSFSPLASPSKLILVPGTTGVLEKKNNRLKSYAHLTENTLAWRDKKLIFNKTRLAQVIKDISHYYNADFDVQNRELLNCRFTSSFENAPLQEVIEALTISLNLVVEKKKDKYILKGKGC